MSTKKLYTVIIFSENTVGLLNQITIIFTRRQLNIETLSVSPSAIKGIHKFTITTYTDEEMIDKVVKQIDVKIILLNNNFLGMVRQWQELFFHERYSFTEMVNPDFVSIAKAYGIAAREVQKREELDEAIQEMVNHKGAYLLVADVERFEMVYPMVPAGATVTNIIMGDQK